MPATPPSRSSCRRLSMALLAIIAVQPAATVLAVEPSRCLARLVPTDSQDVTCPLDASMIDKPLRFVAHFVGSHDDTRLKLTATLAGEPLTCGAGSKTSLVAEDGEVILDCRFKAPTSDAVLQVALSVHHAQFLSAELVPE